MASKITYEDKVAINDSPVNEQNKVTAENMNEIKKVVNENADHLGRFQEPTIVTLDDTQITDVELSTTRESVAKANTVMVQMKDKATGKAVYLETNASNCYYVSTDGTKMTPIKELLDTFASLANACMFFTTDSNPPALLSKLNGYVDTVSAVSSEDMVRVEVNRYKQTHPSVTLQALKEPSDEEEGE